MEWEFLMLHLFDSNYTLAYSLFLFFLYIQVLLFGYSITLILLNFIQIFFLFI